MTKKAVITFLGSGSAFTLGDNYHSNILIELDGSPDKFLFDCGTDVRFSLHDQGLSYLDVNNVYISHLHADHCGGLEWLGLSRKFDPGCDRPRIFLQSSMVQTLWDNRLKGGMQTLEHEEATLASFFDVHAFETDFDFAGIRFQVVKTEHVYNYQALLPSFGLKFALGKTKVFITADAQFVPDVMSKHYHEADVIFHDCETTRIPSTVHSHYAELKTLPIDIKQKMWLYHYNPGPLPNAQRDGFRGFVQRGQKFEFAL